MMTRFGSGVYPSAKNLVTTEIKDLVRLSLRVGHGFFHEGSVRGGRRFVTVIAVDKTSFPRPTATLGLTNGTALAK